MMGVTINGKHSYNDYGLILKSYPVVSPPVPKEKYVDIPGRHAGIDLIRALTGKVQYERRTITLEFTLSQKREEWPAVYSALLNDIQGQEVGIYMDDDIQYIYNGTAKITRYAPGQAVAEMTVEAYVEPYKIHISSGEKVL